MSQVPWSGDDGGGIISDSWVCDVERQVERIVPAGERRVTRAPP